MEIQEFTSQMGVQEIANRFLFLLITCSIVYGLIGFFITKLTKRISIGLTVLTTLCVISLFLIIRWFDQVAREAYMGTIPWLLNMASAIILLPIYLLIMWFLYKRLSKKHSSS
ncbi:hypothetical protein FZW96_19745 [Bacillus sp. BGMRC 2118]|nr:hypothetical protein FZW96_19745 [Bacillus sp. BGMRC 2118]